MKPLEVALQLASVHLYFVRVPLRITIEHALAARHANLTGLLILTASDGTRGIGEFLARDYVMGEAREDIVCQLKRLAPRLLSAPIQDPVALLNELRAQSRDVPQSEDMPQSGKMRGMHGALGALDLALLDLWGKQRGIPAAQLIANEPLALDHTISYSGVYPFAKGLKLQALSAIYRWLLRITELKVKGSGDVARDLDYIRRIRAAFPYSVNIRLDLNASLARANAAAYFSRMLEAGVSWFEQPFAKDAWEASSQFQAQFREAATLCADESVCTMDELEQAIRQRAFAAVNLRIGKNSGLVESMRLYRRAIEAGLKVQLGALVGETSVLAYAGLHFAAATAPLVHYEGCFGKYLLKWDVLSPSLTFGRFGRLSLNRLPTAGLVPEFDLARLERAAHTHEQLG